MILRLGWLSSSAPIISPFVHVVIGHFFIHLAIDLRSTNQGLDFVGYCPLMLLIPIWFMTHALLASQVT